MLSRVIAILAIIGAMFIGSTMEHELLLITKVVFACALITMIVGLVDHVCARVHTYRYETDAQRKTKALIEEIKASMR